MLEVRTGSESRFFTADDIHLPSNHVVELFISRRHLGKVCARVRLLAACVFGRRTLQYSS